jgi:branched-subunit amino acid aminotransferase/4-amino-4-deoxychorismate lyase
MIGSVIIHNGRLEPATTGIIPIDDPDAFHGYGCYEVLRIRGGTLFFPEFHEERLLRSAAILGIQNALRQGELVQALHHLASANGIGECNLKVLLFGREGRNADWFAFLLPPVYPPADSSTLGVTCTLFQGERPFPAAKSLGVLVSTLAFRQAKAKDCWDALLVNRRSEITEGTRTNLFYVDTSSPVSASSAMPTVYTPPAADALEGITRRTLLEALRTEGIPTEERPLQLEEALSGRFCLMITSTSTGVVPVRMLIDEAGRQHELPVAAVFIGIQGYYKQMLGRYTQGN